MLFTLIVIQGAWQKLDTSFFATCPYTVDAPGKIYPNIMSVNAKASAQLPPATLGGWVPIHSSLINP